MDLLISHGVSSRTYPCSYYRFFMPRIASAAVLCFTLARSLMFRSVAAALSRSRLFHNIFKSSPKDSTCILHSVQLIKRPVKSIVATPPQNGHSFSPADVFTLSLYEVFATAVPLIKRCCPRRPRYGGIGGRAWSFRLCLGLLQKPFAIIIRIFLRRI